MWARRQILGIAWPPVKPSCQLSCKSFCENGLRAQHGPSTARYPRFRYTSPKLRSGEGLVEIASIKVRVGGKLVGNLKISPSRNAFPIRREACGIWVGQSSAALSVARTCSTYRPSIRPRSACEIVNQGAKKRVQWWPKGGSLTTKRSIRIDSQPSPDRSDCGFPFTTQSIPFTNQSIDPMTETLADSASMIRRTLVVIAVVIFTNTQGMAQSATQISGSDTAELRLSDDWLDDLRVVEDFSQSLKERFQLRSGGDLCMIQDQRLVLVPAKAKQRFGSLDANGVKLSLGEAVAIDTNLRTSLPEGMSVGLVVGPIRLRLASRKDSLQVSVHDQPLGSLEPPSDSRVTLVLLRDEADPSIFRWVVKAGAKHIAGRAKYTATVADQVQVGILYRSSKQEPKFPVWVDDLRIGRLSNPPETKNAAVSLVNPKSDEAE